MRASTFLVTALSATVYAAPVFPDFNVLPATQEKVDTMTEYFTMLARKVQQGKMMSAAPICDLSKAVMPQDVEPPLPPPSEGLVLKHVAIGRGTQNYTCDLSNSTAIPVANGAMATLFNVSCIAATYPDLAALLSRVSLEFNLTQSEVTKKLAPSNLAISGTHWFTNATTPFFSLDLAQGQHLGAAPCAKDAGSPAPKYAPKGQQGEPAVAWLKLKTRDGATGGLQEVYRIHTAGGSAPATCQGLPASFEVQYATQYWFYGQ